MKDKIIAICLALIICLGLCGCQLALPEGQETGRDRLIGCFITTEHLDLFDFEAYFNDNAHKLVSGGEINLEEDTSDEAVFEDRKVDDIRVSGGKQEEE